MVFNSFAEFLAMGNHGIYVWTCYGLTLVAIIYLVWQANAQRQRFFKEQIQQLKRGQQHES